MKPHLKWWLIGMVLAAPMAMAQTSWKGTSSTSWTTAANWTAGVPTASVDAIIGDANFTGTNQPSLTASGTSGVCRSLTLGTGAKVSTLTVSRSLTVSGSITIGANGRITHTSSSTSRVISLSGSWTNSGTYTGSSSSSAVTFNGAAQFIGGSTATGFRRLTISAGSATVLGSNISVTNTLSVSGTLDPGAGSGLVVSGAGTLSVANGGKILVRASTFAGNYSISGTKTLNAGSTVDYTASGDQTVAGNLTYSTLRISGSGVKSLTNNLTSLVSSAATAGNIEVAAATLNLSTNTANRGTNVTGGTLTVGAGATLFIGGTRSFPSNYVTHALLPTSTVEYGGTNQTVTTETYGNLTLSSAGTATKTMPASTLTIAGNLIAATNGPGASVTFTNGGTLTVNGNFALGAGTTNNGSTFSHSIGGNWTNNGTFTGGSSTITMNGANSVMTGAGANNFFNLTLAQPGLTADANTSLNVAGNFSTSGAGTFTHTAGGSGVMTMSGASKTISGTGITFSKLTISGSASTAASFTVADNLTVNGSLTASAGTITLSGAGKTISGSGTIAFSGLNVPGTVTTAKDYSVAGNLNVAGTFTATAGLTTFNGSTLFSGTANLFNSKLDGVFLRLGGDSILRLAGTTDLVNGTFDVTYQQPNTVVYNGASAQVVYPITYDILEIATAGTKTAGGNINVLSDLRIDTGAVFSGGSGNYTNHVRHHWLNHGTFTAGNSTVEFVGPSDSTIDGATTFNQLRVNKDITTVSVNLYTNNVSVGTLDMASGAMDTSTNTLTITTTRTGNGHVLGTITRQHTFTTGVAYAFEGPFTTINFASLSTVSSVTVATAVGSIGDFPDGAAVNRQYTVSLASSGAYNATFRAYYQDTELNGNDETLMSLWRNSGNAWALSGKTGNSATDNWVEEASLTDLSGRWTMAAESGVARWIGSISTAWEDAGNWTVASGTASRPPSASDIVELGTASATYQPTITSAVEVKAISFGSAQAITLTLGTGGSLQTAGNVAGAWTGNATHTIDVGARTLSVGGDLTLSDGASGHAINLNLSSGTVTVTNTLVESGGANVTCTGAGTLNLAGSFLYSSGTFSAGSGTVNYLGSGAQTVAGVTYNQLGFNKTAGIATLPSPTTVNGNLTLTTAGSVRLNAALVVAGSVTIGTGTTLNLAGSSIDVGGDWTCSGTLDISSGGEVALIGTGAQSIGACAFHDFDIEKPSGTATLLGNISVTLDLDLVSGTLDLGNYTVIQSGGGASLTLGSGTRLRTAGGFPAGYANLTIDPLSTVEYYGSETQTIAAETYGHLIVTNGTSNAKTLAGPTTVAGNLLIANNATLAASSYSLTLLGNWTNNNTFTAGTGAVVLNGTGRTIAGATTFNDLTVGGGYTVANCDITIHGNVTILGSYAAGSGTHTIDGDLYNSGAMSSTGTTTFTGTRLQTIQLLTAIQSVSSGIVNFNGTVAPVLNSFAGPLFATVNINNTGGVTASVGWTVYFHFNVGSGAAFNGSSFTHVFYGTVTNLGTMTSSGTLNFNPASPFYTPADLTLALGNFSSTGIVQFNGTKHITLTSGALSLDSVVIGNTHAAGITPVSNWTLAGNLQIASGAAFHAGSGFTHQIAGNVDNRGTLDGGTSTVQFDGISELGGGGSTVFNNLLVTGILTNSAAVSVTGNFTNNGTFDASGADFSFTGSSASVIAGSTAPTSIDSLIIAKSSATVTLAVNINDLTALTISGGTLDTGAFSVSQNSTDGGNLNVGASGTLKLGGGSTFPTFSTGVTLDPACTVNYSGTAQTVAALPYANLILSGSGNKTLGSTTMINGNLEIGGTAKFNLTYASASYSPVGSLTFGGTLQTAGTWGSTSSSAANKTDTCFQGAGKLNVGNRSLDHFAVTTPGTQMAGASFSLTTITAQDANNNTVATFTGTVDLTETGDGTDGTVSPSQSSAFTAGVLSGQSVTLTKAGAGVTITVADHAGTLKSGLSGAFTVNPGVVNHYAVTFSAPPFYAGVPFKTIVTAQDANNNTITADSSTWVTNSSSSLNMKWDAMGIGEFNNGLSPGQEDHVTKPLTNGVTSFSTRDDVAETGKTITATSSVPAITGTSAAIDIQPLTGAYRSKASGNWGAAGTWETNNGSAWQAAGAAPSASDPVITIQSTHTVTVAADVTVDQVYLLSDGQINVSSGVTLTIGSNSSPGLEISGILNNAGTLTLTNGSETFVWPGGVLENSGTINSTFDTLEFEPGSPGGKYRHLFTTTAGTIPTAEWEVGSVCEIAGYSSSTTPPGGLNQSFHDFIWNCPSQTGTIALGGNPTALGGNFAVTNTGSGALTLGGNLTVTNTTIGSSEAKLNCGTYAISGAVFTLDSGGTLGIGSPDGITSSGNSGNIQTLTRTFSSDGNYIYNGTTAQVPGNGLPAAVNNLTIANSAGVSFSGTISVYSACTVNSGALFIAGGTINGIVVVNGRLAPGNSIGILNTGAENWNGGGSYEFEINDAAGPAGTGWDLLNITGPLTVNATTGSKFTIKVVSRSGISSGPAANFDNAQSYAWRIATTSEGVGGFAADKFTIETSGFQNDMGTVGIFSLSQSGNDVYLNFTPVFANAADYGRAWGTFQRLSVSGLLATYTTGNTTRELVSVATGDQGTAANISGGLILLAPTHNSSETFQYVVQLTGYATSLATNSITLSVTNAVSTVNGISSSGGNVTIQFAGVPGYGYVVERTSDISHGPWTVVTGSATNAPTAGVWTFTDLTPPNPSFYRTRQNN